MIEAILFRPEAEAELAESYRWYEAQRPGLGEDFLSCVDAAISRAKRQPELFPVVHKKVRRALTRRFPFGVFFVIEGRSLVVLAVFHSSRDPMVLRPRTTSPTLPMDSALSSVDL